MRPGLSNELAGRLTFVAAEVVGNHDVAGCEGRHEALADPGGEGVSIDRPVENEGRDDAVVTQPCEEEPAPDLIRGQRFPMPVRDVCCEPPAPRSPTAGPGHVGLDPRFVNKDQALGVKARRCCIEADWPEFPLSPGFQAILMLIGMPSPVNWFRHRTPTAAPVFWLGRVRDFRFAPMIVLKRNIAVSDRERL